LKNTARKKVLHYRQLYADLPDQMVFVHVAVDTSGRLYDDFLRLLFSHAHREACALAGELPDAA
jgi:predicted metal-dependent peptidase